MMNDKRYANGHGLLLVLATVLCGLGAGPGVSAAAASTLKVGATTPDLGALVRTIGGDRVEVSVFVKPTEDPHFAEAKPSYIKVLNEADLFVQNGLDLEVGYAPLLLQQARNPRILPGAPGFLDTSTAIGQPLEVPTTPVDRSMGDVHPDGNPHYLLDPMHGLQVAQALADKLASLDPDGKPTFDANLTHFRDELYRDLVGNDLATKYGSDVPKLVLLFANQKLASFLDGQGQRAQLGGWLGKMLPHARAPVVEDHKIWIYFATLFGLNVVADLEPLPGVPPTTKHLEKVVDLMHTQNVKVVLASAYYDPRYARFVADNTGATVLKMANQVGAVPGTETYLGMVGYNVDQVAGALGSGK
jgi:ABC-type Zn uptake system ZnuABC Zn-binding protein ZnuA